MTNMTSPLIILDRDGTINIRKIDGYVMSIENVSIPYSFIRKSDSIEAFQELNTLKNFKTYKFNKYKIRNLLTQRNIICLQIIMSK